MYRLARIYFAIITLRLKNLMNTKNIKSAKNGQNRMQLQDCCIPITWQRPARKASFSYLVKSLYVRPLIAILKKFYNDWVFSIVMMSPLQVVSRVSPHERSVNLV